MRETAKTPWHLWVVGIVTLVLNGGSAFDYVMTQTRNANYMGNFTPEQLAYFYGFPAWADAAWAIGVWFGVLGSLLLLFRRARAAPMLWISFAATLVTAAYMFLIAETSTAEVMGAGALYFAFAIIAVAGLLAWYGQHMKARGVLV